jgi:hypothetical protein
LFFFSDPRILPGSAIDVPVKGLTQEEQTIEVRGAIKFPLAVQYRRGAKLDYYIKTCGGYRDDADVGNLMIYLPDGTSSSGKGIAPFNPYLLPGSIVDIPVKVPEKK